MGTNEVKHKIIVFGENHHNTLGLIRSLGEMGLFSYLILVNPNKTYPFVEKSRYIKKTWIVYNVDDGLSLILKNFTHEEYKPVIYPTFDSEVKIVGENYDILEKKFILPAIINRKWSLTETLNKEFMCDLAQSVGLITPKSWVIDFSKNDKLPEELVYPCLIKAIDSASGPKSYDIITSEDELLQSIKKMRLYCDMIQIQNYILKKKETMFLGWSNGNGKTVIPCLLYKTRQFPKGLGATAYGYMVKDINESSSVDKLYEFIDKLGYCGLFSVEFLLSNNNEEYFLEINLRNDGNGYLPTFGGVNLPYQWFLAMTDQYEKIEMLPKSIAKDFTFMSEFVDFKYALKYRYPIFKWLNEFRKVNCFLYWNKRDLKPFWYFLINEIKNVLRKGMIKLCQRK